MIRRSPLRSVALAGAAILALAACAGEPNPRGIVVDLIGSVEGPTEEQRACMLDKVEGYSDEEIEALGDSNTAVDFGNPDALEATTPEFQAFVEDLRTCM